MKKSLEKKVHEFNVIIEKDSEGFFIASVPELKGCHTQAKSLDVLIKRTREAIALCWETEGDNLIQNEFIGIQKIALSR